ncbi:MAG: 2'-5' RNA ligase family protein [Thermanaerothrix sp.]|uniref:2'-5' RNA ligase family protein n=1 Tax=Thermanaerothrix sp. TaxID=2972675 RepID=UPI003C7E6D48
MSFAVELYFDPTTDAMVRQAWDYLAEAGVSAVMRESGYRPHLTLGVSESLDLDGAGMALEGLARRYPPFALTLSSLGVFLASEATVFLGVTVTQTLLALHAEFQACIQPYAQGIWDYYRVDAWVPHCTLAFNLPPARVPEAVAIGQQIPLPIRAQVVALGITVLSPASSELLRLFPLGDPPILVMP